jgi:hypothetical protein
MITNNPCNAEENQSENTGFTLNVTRCSNENYLHVVVFSSSQRVDKAFISHTGVSFHTGVKPQVLKLNISSSECRTTPKRKDNKCIRTAEEKQINIQKDEKLNECHVPGKADKQMGDLKIHIRTHTGEKPHKCDVSSSEFRTTPNRKDERCGKTEEEKQKNTQKDETLNECHISGKADKQTDNLGVQIRTDTDDKLYKCDVCGKMFYSEENIKSHMGNLTGEEFYKCNVCENLLNHEDNVDRQERIHAGDTSESYENMKKHTKERPYKCYVCGKQFCQTRSLYTHMRTHSH